MKNVVRKSVLALAAAGSAVLFTSCGRHKEHDSPPDTSTSSAAPENVTISRSVVTPPAPPVPPKVVTPTPPKVVTPPAPPPKVIERPIVVPKPETVPAVERADRKAVRIQAGSVINWKDKQGQEWLADAGFTEGAMANRGEVSIEKTENPDLYKSERTNMEKFTWPVPNGKYQIRLHFAENVEDVKKVGERVFSIEALGEKISNLDIFKEAGGANKALIKTLKVNVSKGKIEINFIKTEQKEPLINGIEILPE